MKQRSYITNNEMEDLRFMGFDLKGKIDEIISKVKGDPKLLDKFQKDP